MPTLYHHIYGFSMFNTLTKALHVIVSILQVISSFSVFNKPLEIPSYIPLFSQCYCDVATLQDNGVVYSDPQSKAELINRAFPTVFTSEDTSTMPVLSDICIKKFYPLVLIQMVLFNFYKILNHLKLLDLTKFQPVFCL